MGLLKFLRGSSGGPPPVTGTASFGQSAAEWEASAIVANPVTSTAAWSQTQSWAATASERFTSTASFVQAAATWDAEALERLTSTATWSQDASWAALGLHAEDVTATAAFEQAAASWLAATAELVVGSGTWQQANTWLAALVESITATATWQQGASWDATGDVDNPVVPVNAVGEWTQTATWSAVGSTPVVIRRRRGSRLVTTPFLPTPPPFIEATASFTQAPATWRAVMDVNDDEPLLLSDLLELVA
jgi:hypothetical protein